MNWDDSVGVVGCLVLTLKCGHMWSCVVICGQVWSYVVRCVDGLVRWAGGDDYG